MGKIVFANIRWEIEYVILMHQAIDLASEKQYKHPQRTFNRSILNHDIGESNENMGDLQERRKRTTRIC